MQKKARRQKRSSAPVRNSAPPSTKNIQRIAELEHAALHARTLLDRISDAITGFSGSMVFVLIHAFWSVAWIVINEALLEERAFDPYPFTFLTFLFALEAILLSAFILMTQNRMSRQAELRTHLDLQVNLLAEQELTMVLQLVKAIADRVGVEIKEEQRIKVMETRTDVHELAKALDARLPE